jgi:predicted metal-dependent hydrolase
MPQKILKLEGIGTTKFYKRRGTRSLRITLAPDHVRVTMPLWMPYASGLAFVQSKKAWIKSHQKESILLEEGARIGKAHRLYFTEHAKDTKPTVRTTKTEIKVSFPCGQSTRSHDVQQAAKRGIYKALKDESENLLPLKLKQLAQTYGFSYKSVSCKRMRARWGSCNHQKEITLNIFLMQLPWEFIDYVLVHELVHTKHLHHGADFWQEFERCMPQAKTIRKSLKNHQPAI